MRSDQEGANTPNNASLELRESDYNEGVYDIKANDSQGDKSTIELVADATEPEISFLDNEYVKDDPTITVEMEDELTDVEGYGVENADNGAEVESISGFDSCSPGSPCTAEFEIDTSNMNDGDSFQLTINATDEVGNVNDDSSKTFKLDRGYEGDTPSFEVEEADDSNNIKMDDEDDDYSLTAYLDELDNGEDSRIRIECYDEDGRFDKTDYENVDEEGFQFGGCDVPGSDYDGSKEDFYVKACDEAGNCDSAGKKTYSFDLEDPFLTDIDTVEEYDVYNKDFDLEFTAGDDASGIETMEYVFESGTAYGKGNEVEADGDNKFTVDTSTLSKGEHTVYFRVKDEVGRWSSQISKDFEFYPNERPEVSVDVVDTYNLTAGTSGSVQVRIRNSGKLFVPEVNLSVSGGNIVSDQRTISNLDLDDSVPVNLEVSANETQIGLHEVEIETSNPQTSEVLEVLVKANSDQRENVESRLQEYRDRLRSLEDNVSDLRKSGLNTEMNETLTKNISGFSERVRNSERYVESGEYYKALSELQNIDSSYEVAADTFTDVKKKHDVRKRNRILMISGLILIVVLLGAGIHFFRKGEVSIDLTEEDIPGLIGAEETFREKFEGLKEFVEKEEEEVEKKFEGFN